jgi:hypothetical protein
VDTDYILTIHDALTGEITTRPMTDEEIAQMPIGVDTFDNEEP